MTELCLGTVQFGTYYGIQGNDRPREKEVFDILLYALEHHIELFDTASVYGDAETLLGEFIRRYPRTASKIRIISKLRPDALDKSSMDSWSRIIKKDAEQSLQKMGIDSFDTFFFHDASLVFDPEAVRALSKLKQDGLTKAIGVSIYNPEEAMKALDYKEIDAIQVPYNVFDHRLDKCGFFGKAERQGVKVYVRSILLQGLAVMNPYSLPLRVSFARDYLIKFDELCKDSNISRLEASLGYVFQKKGVSCIVFGVDNKRQLMEHVKLKEIEMPKEMVKQIDEIFGHVPEKLVNPVLWD